MKNLISIFILFCSLPALAVSTIDYRYGRIVDNSKDLRDGGFVSRSRGVSMMSGPVCVENALEKMRPLLTVAAVDPIADLKWVALRKPQVVEQGIQREDLKSLIETAMARMPKAKVEVTLHEISSDGFKIEDLRKTTGDHDVILAQIWWWSPLAFSAKDPWTVDAEGTRWVLITGFDAANTTRFFVQDPSVQQTVAVHIEPQFEVAANKVRKKYMNYQVRYDVESPYSSDRIALIGNYIHLHF